MSKFATFLLSLLVLTLSALVVVQSKKDRNAPHPHRGILTPYKPGPFPDVSLTRKEEEMLKEGKSVMKQSLPNAGDIAKSGYGPPPSGGALCIQDVDAPVEAVWYQILNLNDYTSKVPKLKSSQNYLVKENKKGGTYTIKTKMVLSAFPGYSFESYYDHTYYPKKSSLTWTLDYDKTSDFHDVAGHWHVQDLSNSRSRVFYACDVQMSGPIPTPLLNYIGKAALKQATAWVKRESEAHADKRHPYTPRTTHYRTFATAAAATTTTSKETSEKKGKCLFGLAKPKWAFQKR